MTQLQARLYRDSFSTPWGFRIQGGKDIGQALSIQRVFSNSPAEGELQRGDRILSIAGRPGQELTHQQAQDIVRRGGAQLDVVVHRPVPRGVSSTATFTPAAQRPVRVQPLQLSPVLPSMPGYGGSRHRLDVSNPCYNPDFLHQYSPSSPHPPPPWTRQPFAPMKVSKKSQLGGGSPDFGVDYGSHYGTVPRRRHSQSQSFRPMSYSQHAGDRPFGYDYGPSHLGGRNFDYGTDYCTLPRNRIRQTSQPPASRPPFSTMPMSGGSSGFKPKKVTLSRLGGGGPDFGSDFTRHRAAAPTSMYHDSLDNLSPRAPDYGYQAPQFAATSSWGGGGQYVPTAVRLDMEREEELRQQQLQQQYHQPEEYQSPPQQQYHFEPQPSYVPTSLRLDQQMGEEDQGDHQPVWERRKAFMNAPARPAPAMTGKSTAPRVLRPKPGSGGGFNFGVDYSKPTAKTSTVTWRPQSAQRPVNVPPPPSEMTQSAPTPWSSQPDEGDQADVPPAWRTSLRATGVKPWDKDLEYSAGQQEPTRSVGYQPTRAPGPSYPAPAPFLPQQEGQDGPRVVHLQYNSPMDLYSKENVRDTFAGQTKAMAATGVTPPVRAEVQNPERAGDRDWTQSAVYRMIYEEEHRGRPGGQQQQQQPKPPPPPPAPKPQVQTFQQAFTPMDGELGTSDF